MTILWDYAPTGFGDGWMSREETFSLCQCFFDSSQSQCLIGIIRQSVDVLFILLCEVGGSVRSRGSEVLTVSASSAGGEADVEDSFGRIGKTVTCVY